MSTTELVTGSADDPVTPRQEQAIGEAITALSPSAYLDVERGFQNRLTLPLAVLAGLGAVLVLIATSYGDSARDAHGAAIAIPWAVLGTIGVLVPRVAVAVTGLAVRSRLPMDRRIT